MSTRAITNTLTFLLSSAGILIAGLLTIEHFQPDLSLPCGSVGGGCKGVLQGPYGHIGPIPTALFGLGMYGMLAVFCVLRRNRLRALRTAESADASVYAFTENPPVDDAIVTGDASLSDTAPELPSLSPVPSAPDMSLALQQRAELKRLDFLVWLLAATGVGISWWLQYTALVVLKSFCPWCFTSAITITLILALASRDYLLEGRQLTGEQKMLAGVSAFILVLMGLVFLPTIKFPPPPPPPSPPASKPPAWMKPLVMSSEMHVKGNPNAPITIVEFADFQCPACNRSRAEIDSILERGAGKVKVAFRNFPLEMHSNARKAAIAAEAAGAQGKFWEMYKYLYDHQEELESPDFSEDTFLEFATAAGLDVARFKQEMESGMAEKRVQQDVADAKRCKVRMTPTFFVLTPQVFLRIQGPRELVRLLKDPDKLSEVAAKIEDSPPGY